ncbi:hypothetical protein [Jatrophihabitans sp.]|uniref:hypothetical protein n=1 Tax=Jatrophihabitans sp. TaxID=1932789 RepID=UPI0030C700AC|nr:hypothetical protein [Jatrophihabitans sp.]
MARRKLRSRQVRRCDVYWGMDFCALQHGHEGPHIGIGSNAEPPHGMTLSGSDAPTYAVASTPRRRGLFR